MKGGVYWKPKRTTLKKMKDLMRAKRNDYVLKFLQGFCPELIKGSHKCKKSFYGTCIQKDEGSDEICIFCGDPEEQK